MVGKIIELTLCTCTMYMQGADVNARNCLGCVPLMYAAGSGQLQVYVHTVQYSNTVGQQNRYITGFTYKYCSGTNL